METQSKAKELWFENLEGMVPSTKRQYLYVVDRFLAFSKIGSLEALYQLKVDDEKAQDQRDATRVESLVKKFLQSELRRGTAGKLISCFEMPSRVIRRFVPGQGLP